MPLSILYDNTTIAVAKILGDGTCTHHVHILEMNGESFRLRQSRTTKT